MTDNIVSGHIRCQEFHIKFRNIYINDTHPYIITKSSPSNTSQCFEIKNTEHLIFDKGGKNIQWIKDNLFNKWCWENWSTTCERMKLEHFLTPYTKINSKWIKDLNQKLKNSQRRTQAKHSDIHHGRILYEPPPRILEIKAKINKWNLIKIKSFCTMKDTISKVEKAAFRMGENNSK